jgi:hypothetical protein
MCGIPGLIFFVLAIALAFFVHRSWWVAAGLMGFLLAWLFLGLLGGGSAREAARRAQCANNLKQLALAIHNYNEVYGHFPPAYVADKDDKPMHSWRVLILPFMDDKALYDRYDLNEPWDGPNNKKLLAARPSMYACPSGENAWTAGSAHTSYVAVVGPDAVWRGETPRSTKDVDLNGKLANTIMLVETADANINWMEPRDFSLDALQNGDSPPASPTISSKHVHYNGFFYQDTSAGAQVALADGSVRHLPAKMLVPGRLVNMLKIGGFDPDEIGDPWDSGEAPIHWPHCVALVVWLLSVGLLLRRAVRSRRAGAIGTTGAA